MIKNINRSLIVFCTVLIPCSCIKNNYTIVPSEQIRIISVDRLSYDEWKNLSLDFNYPRKSIRGRRAAKGFEVARFQAKEWNSNAGLIEVLVGEYRHQKILNKIFKRSFVIAWEYIFKNPTQDSLLFVGIDNKGLIDVLIMPCSSEILSQWPIIKDWKVEAGEILSSYPPPENYFSYKLIPISDSISAWVRTELSFSKNGYFEKMTYFNANTGYLLSPDQLEHSHLEDRPAICYHQIPSPVKGLGKIKPKTEVSLFPEVSGEIIELTVREGDGVEKGQLLVRIKPDIYIAQRDRSMAAISSANARLEQAEALFTQAELSFRKAKQLYNELTISKSEYEKTEVSYNAAKKNIDAAKLSVVGFEKLLREANENLIKTSIYSPISGTVTRISVKVGERVLGSTLIRGNELLNIANLSKSWKVDLEVSENGIVKLNVGDSVYIKLDAFPKELIKGAIIEISKKAGLTYDNSFMVNCLIKNPNARFRPGMSAEAVFSRKGYLIFQTAYPQAREVFTTFAASN